MDKIFDIHKIWAYAISCTLGFFEPLWVLLLWFFIFVMCDTITGISASIKERQIITSHKLQKTIRKLVMYTMAIILVHSIDVYMMTLIDLGLAKICASIICGIELYSIFENCYRITGNRVFKILTQFTLKKIETETGIDIKGDE